MGGGGREERCGAGAPLEIVQVVRRLHPHGGVGRVAHQLQHAFEAAGVAGPPITAEALGLAEGSGRLGRMAEIVAFTWRGSLAARRARARGVVVVVHGDALGGDIYVDHGLHLALVKARPWLVFNPLHLFILAREGVRSLTARRRRGVCLSKAGAAELARTYPWIPRSTLRVLPNGVELERFRPAPACDTPGEAPTRLVFVGHEFGRKGLFRLLAALTHLPPRFTLQVVGGRPAERARAERCVRALGLSERVALLGVRTDVEQVLQRSDLLVLPSAREAFPLVALEALACGAPVLLAGVPAAPELIGEEEEGAAGAVTGRTPRAIAEAILRLTADPVRFAAMRRAARARALRYGWPEVAAGYLALCTEVHRARTAAAA